MSLGMALLVVLLVSLVVGVVAIFAISFNWRLLSVWNGGPTFLFHRMGSLFRYIETIEGPLLENKVRPFIGYVCHVTFFPCDTKYLGDFTICFTSTEGYHFVKIGYHWKGKCACKEKHDVQPMVRMKS